MVFTNVTQNPSLQAQGKGLLGYVPELPTTVPFDDSYAKGSDDLPLDQPPLAKLVNETAPEQIHIALAGGLSLPPLQLLTGAPLVWGIMHANPALQTVL